MRRIASHYIYWRQFYRLHYVELNDNGVLAGIFPLEGEIAGTEFYKRDDRSRNDGLQKGTFCNRW